MEVIYDKGKHENNSDCIYRTIRQISGELDWRYLDMENCDHMGCTAPVKWVGRGPYQKVDLCNEHGEGVAWTKKTAPWFVPAPIQSNLSIWGSGKSLIKRGLRWLSWHIRIRG